MTYKVALIVCGHRHWHDYRAIFNRLNELPQPLFLIAGGAPGADTLAERWFLTANSGVDNGLHVESAKWEEYGRAAGPIRNQEMLKILLATEAERHLVMFFHRDLKRSRGTLNMVNLAHRKGVEIVQG